jgi:hypothetical protein
MNKKVIKAIAGACCIVGALGMSFQGSTPATEAEKNATTASKSAKELLITVPESESEYGVGTYRVEGLVPKGAEVTLYVDRKEFKTLKANSEDGSYDAEIKIDKAGKHVVLAEFKDAKGEKAIRKLEFEATNDKMSKEVVATKHGDEKAEGKNEENPEATGFLPENNDEDVLIPGEGHKEDTKPTDPNSGDPNDRAHRVANGEKDKHVPPGIKPKTNAKPPVKPNTAHKVDAHKVDAHKSGTKPAAKKAAFVVSSHTNFNVVPHGMLQFGGKGTPGNKIMILVDGKPSMRGTVKPDGRWKFPIKISSAGFRKITAQNLTTRESKTVKLKIQ